MIATFNAQGSSVRIVAGFTIAIAGGFVCAALNFPLPWLIGSLTTTAVASLFGLQLGIPDPIRKGGQVLAGFAVGLFFSPNVGQQVLSIGWLMILTGCMSLVASALVAFLLVRMTGCDRNSAFFAMIPGGLAEMAGFAQKFGANVTLVSLSQSLRIVTIVFTIPPLLIFLLDGEGRPEPDYATLTILPLAVGLALATAAAFAFKRLRIFNPWLLGGLMVGVIFGLSLGGDVFAPDLIPIAAQVAIGTALGARFEMETIRAMGPRFVPASIGCTLVLIAFNALMAVAIAAYVDLPTGILATAPGGIAEMSLTAEALFLTPPLVTAWQLLRILLVATLTAPVFRFYQRV